MNKDIHPSALKETEYSYAKNLNLEDSSGNSLNATNEKSNILATKFKEGFKVIHAVNDIDTTNTYFFLVNPETGVGEFGVVENNQDINDLSDIALDCPNCASIKELAEPLENLEQLELQTYTTKISDECHVLNNEPEKGFNFNILQPIKKSVIKNEKCGKTIYFSHIGNPPRHINIDRIQDYFIQENVCADDTILTCPDFDKMRIFKLFNIPQLVPASIELGGNLKMGVYEFLIAYCDAEGREISEYFSITNPISVFDRNNIILGQPNLADRTGFAIRLNVEGLDTKYTHYKIAVIQTADIEGATRYFIEGIHTVNDTSIVYSTEQNKTETSVDNLARISLHVEETEGVATANNILYQYGVTSKKEINLQPVVNLMGQFLQWQSHIAPENLYENGIAVSLYTGYNREEVVPFGIKFLLDGGYETSIFPFIGRIATEEDLEIVVDEETGEPVDVDNMDITSILANKSDCNSTIRTRRWQYYNDATVEDVPCSTTLETITVTEEINKFCIVENIATVEAGTVSIELDTEFTNLEDFINDNIGNSEAECSEFYENSIGGNICEALYADYSDIECVDNPFAGLECETPTIVGTPIIEVSEIRSIIDVENIIKGKRYRIETLGDTDFTLIGADSNTVGEEFIATLSGTGTGTVSFEGELSTRIPKVFGEDYTKIVPPRVCNIYKIDTSSGNKEVDTTASDVLNMTVYKRDSDFIEESCAYAATINENQNPVVNNGASYFNNYYYSENNLSELKTTKNALGASIIENIIFQAGTGDVTVTIDGNTFFTAYAGSLPATASSFHSTHQSAIETLTGGVLSVSGNIVTLTDSLIINIDEIFTTSDLYVKYEATAFTDKIHKGALWFSGNTNARTKFILDISKQKVVSPIDSLSDKTQTVRMSIFKSCTATDPIFSEFIDLNQGAMFQLEKSGADLIITKEDGTPYTTITSGWFSNKKFFVVIDNRIIGTANYDFTFGGLGELLAVEEDLAWATTPSKGCYTVSTRNLEDKRIDVSWSSITLRKKIEYTATCSFEQPIVQACKAVPYKRGNFAYWESQEVYPDNTELFNSAFLTIKENQIPLSIRDKFEESFATVDIEGNYLWKFDDTGKELVDFTCRNIRHFKFPDNGKSPFMYDIRQLPFSSTIIFPLGITIDEEVINAFLDIAESNNLISKQDRQKITGYEIVRGDLTLNRSVLSSGLLYDMREYSEKGKNIKYPNYPFNSYSPDKLNQITQSEFGESNSNYTFHSPETDYFRPTLPSELSVQGYMYGNSRGHFDEVLNHPKYTVLTDKAIELAGVLAGLEVVAEAAVRTAQTLASTGQSYQLSAGVVVVFNPGGIVTAILAYAADLVANITKAITDYGRYRYQWLETFRNLGKPHNFAYYYFAEGKYNFLQLEQEDGQKTRSLNISKYLKEGIERFSNEVTAKRIDINNINRETSVFLSFGNFPLTYPSAYKNYDKDVYSSSLFYSSEIGISDSGRSTEIQRNIASPYVALKTYMPQQHGTINTIKWLNTGYRGDLTNPRTDCLSIFGGDTFISRHTLKRKHSQFLVTAMGQADRTPFNYFFYNNIGRNPLFYISYEIDKEFDQNGKFFPDISSDFNFDSSTKSRFYYKPPSKFYLYYYGIPNFLCETRINTNFRYAEEPYHRQFFPQVGDLGEWTQEKNVPIREKNWFFYNRTYSKQTTPLKLRTLYNNYNKTFNDCKTDFPNGIIASLPDNSENNSYDPWLIYRPLDFFEFPTNYGKLIDVQGIENEAILTRFENTSILYNKVDTTVDDGQNPSRNFLGGSVAFQRRSASFYNAQLGFGGTQNTTSVSCEFGHFHVDAKRGQVIQTQPTGQQMEEISSSIGGKPSGMRNWFKEHLPFKILKYFKDVDTDNNYNGIGISMAWDSRFRRVFITKKDYIPKQDCVLYQNGHFYSNCDNCNDVNGIDAVFIIDKTSSQQPAIDNIKNNIITQIVPAIQDKFGNNYRLGLVAVNDSLFSGVPLFTINVPMSLQNETQFFTEVSNLTAVGGGATPEPTDKALRAVLDNTQRIDNTGATVGGLTIGEFRTDAAKAIFLITDALPSGLNDAYDITDWNNVISISNDARERGIQIFPFQTSFLQGTDIAPDIPNNILPSLSYVMKYYADQTNGVYNFNSNGTGISGEVVNIIAENIECPLIEVSLEDSDYFQDVSWTIAYSPILGTWMSFYDFKPNYYISHNNYFQSGINSTGEDNGLWSHLLTNKSYQVFYGNKYPFELEIPVKSDLTTKKLESVILWTEAKRYHNEYDWAIDYERTFDKSLIWNNMVCSGYLNLIPQKNNFAGNKNYPKTNSDNTQDILISNKDGFKWTYNYFFDRVRTNSKNVPFINYDKNQIEKTIDNSVITFTGNKLLKRLEGDWFLNKLSYSKDSRFSLTFKFAVSNVDV